MDLERLFLWGILVANLAILPFFVYLFVVSLAAALVRKPQMSCEPSSLRFLVAIPAHNEEAGIAATVRSCLAVDYPGELFEVLVIADNCEDQTAALARAEGASVLERTHPTDRSKGHRASVSFR